MPTNRPQSDLRPARVLRILLLIQREPAQWTRKRLAERFELSERMIAKDIELIRSVGYVLRHHRTGYELAEAPAIH